MPWRPIRAAAGAGGVSDGGGLCYGGLRLFHGAAAGGLDRHPVSGGKTDIGPARCGIGWFRGEQHDGTIFAPAAQGGHQYLRRAAAGLRGDLELKVPEGEVKALIVFGPCRFFGLFGRGEDFYVPWDCVQRFGDDIILIDKPFQRREEDKKRRRWG